MDDNKLAGTLALVKTVVVTGWNGKFSISIGALVTISTIVLVSNTVTAEIGDGFLDVDIYDKLSGTLSLGKTGIFVATVVNTAIDKNRAVSICAAKIGDCLSGPIGSSVSSFYSSSVILSWYFWPLSSFLYTE